MSPISYSSKIKYTETLAQTLWSVMAVLRPEYLSLQWQVYRSEASGFYSQRHQEYWNSGFRRKVAKNFDLLGYYAERIGNFLPKFRKRNYHNSLRNNPENRSSFLSIRSTYFPSKHWNLPWALELLSYFCVLPTVRKRISVALFPPYLFKSQRLDRHKNIFAFSSDSFIQVSSRQMPCAVLGPATFRSLFRCPISFSDAPKYIELHKTRDRKKSDIRPTLLCRKRNRTWLLIYMCWLMLVRSLNEWAQTATRTFRRRFWRLPFCFFIKCLVMLGTGVTCGRSCLRDVKFISVMTTMVEWNRNLVHCLRKQIILLLLRENRNGKATGKTK
jgi:hypothetical protein